MQSTFFIFCIVLVATVTAFHAPVTISSRPARMTMLFDFFKKKDTVAAAPTKSVATKAKPAMGAVKKSVATKVDTKFKPLTGSASKGQYIPEGLTKEQYEKFAKAAAEKKAKSQKKFYIGKNAETLTEWMLAEEAKGNVGKGLLSNHRLVKCKYEGWYTDESPV